MSDDQPDMREGEHIVPAEDVRLLGIELGGVGEISEEFGIARSTISMWNRRRTETNGFPRPLAHLKSGPVYDMAEIRRWWADRHGNERSTV